MAHFVKNGKLRINLDQINFLVVNGKNPDHVLIAFSNGVERHLYGDDAKNFIEELDSPEKRDIRYL